MTVAPRADHCTTPTPDPSPAGCGLVRFRQILEVTKPRQAAVWLGGGRTEQAARPRSRRNSGGVELGGVFHRLDDFDGASAAADVAAHRCADVVLAWMRLSGQQAPPRQCASRPAIAPLA